MGMFGDMCICNHNTIAHSEGFITNKHPCQVDNCNCKEFRGK